MRHAPAAALLAGVFLLAACASEPAETEGAVTTTSVSPAAPSAFCIRLHALDDELRVVRSYGDDAASVKRYTRAITTLDVAFRAVRARAPEDLDLAPIEYANGRFGEIVRAMPPDLGGPSARAAVAINLESYNTAVFQALVAACGSESVGAP